MSRLQSGEPYFKLQAGEKIGKRQRLLPRALPLGFLAVPGTALAVLLGDCHKIEGPEMLEEAGDILGVLRELNCQDFRTGCL